MVLQVVLFNLCLAYITIVPFQGGKGFICTEFMNQHEV